MKWQTLSVPRGASCRVTLHCPRRHTTLPSCLKPPVGVLYDFCQPQLILLLHSGISTDSLHPLVLSKMAQVYHSQSSEALTARGEISDKPSHRTHSLCHGVCPFVNGMTSPTQIRTQEPPHLRITTMNFESLTIVRRPIAKSPLSPLPPMGPCLLPSYFPVIFADQRAMPFLPMPCYISPGGKLRRRGGP